MTQRRVLSFQALWTEYARWCDVSVLCLEMGLQLQVGIPSSRRFIRDGVMSQKRPKEINLLDSGNGYREGGCVTFVDGGIFPFRPGRHTSLISIMLSSLQRETVRLKIGGVLSGFIGILVSVV